MGISCIIYIIIPDSYTVDNMDIAEDIMTDNIYVIDNMDTSDEMDI